MKAAVYMFVVVLGLGLAGEWGWLDLPLVTPTSSLGKLVTRSQARELSEFYGALATVVRSGDVDTTSGFRNTQILAAKILQANAPGSQVGLSRINAPINQRLTSAIGVDGEIPDGPITPEMREALSSALTKISEDFR